MICHLNARQSLRATGNLGLVVACLIQYAPLFAQEPKPRATLKGHTDEVRSLAFSPDGNTLASGSDDHSIKLWDVATGRNATTLQEKDPYLWGTVAFSPDGKTLATGGWFNKVKLWDLGSLKGTLVLDHHWQCPPPVIAFSPDGKKLVSGGVCRGEMELWDVAAGKSIAALVTHEGVNAEGVLAVAFTPDGKKLASISRPDEIKLWDTATGKNTGNLKTDTPKWQSIAHSAAFSPDGKTLATPMYNKDGDARHVNLWNVETGKVRVTLEGHMAYVCSVVFSSDGKVLACGCEDGTIKLWSVTTSKELATLKGHTDKVCCLALSADGMTLASGSADKTIKLWDMAKAK